jgi:DNA-binding transcriptional LysR family regulator
MELRHLRYFVAIAEERSFTRAAERLWVAQPGLSTQIRRLESELGVQLFARHTRGVDLTEAGGVFLERARAALAAAQAASDTGREVAAGLVGWLRLGLSAEARWHAGSTLLARFAEERPGVEVTVLEGDGGTLWRDLRDGRLDALIAPSIFASPDVRALDLGSEPWVVLVGRGHRLAGGGPLDAAELAGESIAVTRHRDGAAYDRAIADMLAALDVAATPVPRGPGPALFASVAAGDAVLLTTGADSLPPGLTTRPLRPRRTLAFRLLWCGDAPAPALSRFIELAAVLARRAPLAVAA